LPNSAKEGIRLETIKEVEWLLKTNLDCATHPALEGGGGRELLDALKAIQKGPKRTVIFVDYRVTLMAEEMFAPARAPVLLQY
jgi:hypothetical protein